MGASWEQEKAVSRFAEHLDSFGDGTAHFMGEAMEAYLEK